MCDWLPVDGSQHEGPGYGSSAGALGMAFQVSDELTGTRFLDSPFYRTGAAYTMQVSAPGMTEACTSPTVTRCAEASTRSS